MVDGICWVAKKLTSECSQIFANRIYRRTILAQSACERSWPEIKQLNNGNRPLQNWKPRHRDYGYVARFRTTRGTLFLSPSEILDRGLRH